MIIPVPGSQLPPAGSIRDYLYQRSPTHTHRGVDLVAPLGSPVLAAESGTVIKTVHHYTVGFRGYGKVIVIHGVTGRYFLYAHLNSILVSENAKVFTGQPIGTVGDTVYSKDDPEGRMRGQAHLHFEISANPYPQPAEAPRLNPLPELRVARGDKPIEPEQPITPPKKAAARLRKMEISDRATIAISIAIMGLIWLLTLLKK